MAKRQEDVNIIGNQKVNVRRMQKELVHLQEPK